MRTRLLLAALVAVSISCSDGPTTPTARNYGGRWTGNFLITTCSATGVYQTLNQCGAVLGTFSTYTFAFTQSGSSVNGTVEMGALKFTLNPTNTTNNRTLSLTVETAENNADGTVSRIVAQWSLLQPDIDDLQGSNSTTITVLPNAANITGTLTFGARMSSSTLTR
jgi:hypothetical protein